MLIRKFSSCTYSSELYQSCLVILIKRGFPLIANGLKDVGFKWFMLFSLNSKWYIKIFNYDFFNESYCLNFVSFCFKI